MNLCDLCEEYGDHDCKHCNLGNPCIGCSDYDMLNDTCTSEGACGDPDKKYIGLDGIEERLKKEEENHE